MQKCNFSVCVDMLQHKVITTTVENLLPAVMQVGNCRIVTAKLFLSQGHEKDRIFPAEHPCDRGKKGPSDPLLQAMYIIPGHSQITPGTGGADYPDIRRKLLEQFSAPGKQQKGNIILFPDVPEQVNQRLLNTANVEVVIYYQNFYHFISICFRMFTQ